MEKEIIEPTYNEKPFVIPEVITNHKPSEYWFFSLFYFLSSIVVLFLDGIVFGYEVNGVFSIIIDFIFFFPSISLIVRRLHDVNRSGWWFLIVLTGIGLLVILYWYLKKGCEKSNRFGKCSLGALRKRS